MPGVRPALRDDAPRRLEHHDDRRLVVGAEDRPAGVADDAVLDHGLERPVGGTVSRWAQRKIGVPPRPLAGQPAEDVARSSSRRRRRRRPRPTRGRVASSSAITRSATARSSPGGLGIAQSSRKQVERRPSRQRASRLDGERAAPTRARAALEGRADEPAEERRRPRRARLELRVELARDEPRMVGQLDDLDEPALLERARDDEPVLDELVAELVVDLVAVPVALVDRRLAVDLARARALAELDRLRAEAHRAAEVLDLLLLGQQVDHRVRRLRVHLGRVGALEPARRGGRTRETATCIPRQMPRYGIPRSRATRQARILPSQPREPNPPGHEHAVRPCSSSSTASS